MRILNSTVETYRIDTEAEVKAFIEEQQADALQNGYMLTEHTSKFREKKQKGEVIDSAYLVKITKTYAGFWDGLEDTVE